MEVNVKSGTYVLAVSGGVDSMVLLDVLAHRRELELIVAHFDHGIRPDGEQDRALVAAVAAQHNLPFVFARGHLGATASEATARAARYAFLHQTRDRHAADALITAHHQDDLLETALINMVRGTGPRGLSSLRSTPDIVRPLLHVPKKELLTYAREHGLRWREDSTNTDERYLRNYLRRQLVPRMSATDRQRLLHCIAASQRLQTAIQQELQPRLTAARLDRAWFRQLPYAVSAEAIALWLRARRLPFDRKAIHRLVTFAKTAPPGRYADAGAGFRLQTGKNYITVLPPAGLR